MQVKWVFEKDAYRDGNTEAMIDYCRRKNIDHQLVDFVIMGSDDHIDWKYGPDEAVVVYGAIGMTQHVLRKKKWYPGAWCDWNQLKATTYLTHWGQHSIQQDYAFLPIAEIHRRWNQLFAHYSFDGHVFIKPDDNDKRFHGEKVAMEYRDEWYRLSTFYGAPPESLAMISRPSRIMAEWRFVIADRKVVTGSLYRADGVIGMSRVDPSWQFDAGAMEFAEAVANSTDWQPAPIYSLDVCMTENEKYRLMECGSINCCGLYKCDVSKVIDAANAIALREWLDVHRI